MKGIEIEALLRSVNPLCEMAEEAQAHEVQMSPTNRRKLRRRKKRTAGGSGGIHQLEKKLGGREF